jgi:hypothetical protein
MKMQYDASIFRDGGIRELFRLEFERGMDKKFYGNKTSPKSSP